MQQGKTHTIENDLKSDFLAALFNEREFFYIKELHCESYEAISEEDRFIAMNNSSKQLVFKKGDMGQEVRRLQKALTHKGFILKDDGDFGPKTEAELQRFQGSVGLTPDAIAGKRTRSKLDIDMYFGIDVSPVSYTHLTLPTKA